VLAGSRNFLGLLLATFALAYALPVGCSLVMADGLWPKFLLSAALTAGCGVVLASRRCVSGGR